MRRKVLAWLLTLSMVFTMMPYSAFATDSGSVTPDAATETPAVEEVVTDEAVTPAEVETEATEEQTETQPADQPVAEMKTKAVTKTVTTTNSESDTGIDTEAELNAAITAGGTVKLTGDIQLTDTVTIPAGTSVTLDLNGKTISQEKACTGNYNMILNKGALTITGNGKISFKDTGAGDPNFSWGSYTVRNEGTLVVENGTIEHLGEQNANGSVKHMYCAIFQYEGSTTIKGGTISTPTYRSVRLWKGDMTITDGTFEGQVWVQAVDDTAKMTITGGSFEPRGVDGSSVFVGNVTDTGKQCDVDFVVTGGTFATKVGASNAEAVAGAITGGTFTNTSGMNTALLAPGLTFGEDGELVKGGTWGGIDWTLTEDGTLTIASTKGKPVADKNSGKTYEVGEWREAVRYNSAGEGEAIDGWPYDRTKVKDLIIEEGVTSIGSFTAQGFTNLTGEVVIPSTVTYIGQEAFQKSKFTKLTFAEGGTEELCIGPGAFKEIDITELSLPIDRTVHIHCWAFNNCKKLEDVTIPSTVTAFSGWTHVEYEGMDFVYNQYRNASDILAGCTALETLSFGSEEVEKMFNDAQGNKATINNLGVVVDPVAQIGEKVYATLQEAIAAAKANDIVEILASEIIFDENAASIVVDKAITIAGAGKDNTKLVFNSATSAFVVQSSNVTFKDMTIVQGIKDNSFHISVNKGAWDAPAIQYSDIKIQNIAFNGGDYALCLIGENIVVEGCTFTDQDSHNIIVYSLKGDSQILNNVFNASKGSNKSAILYEGGADNATDVSGFIGGGTLTIKGNTANDKGVLFQFTNWKLVKGMNLVIKDNKVDAFTNKAIALYDKDGAIATNGDEFASITVNKNVFTNVPADRPILKEYTGEFAVDATGNYLGSDTPDLDALLVGEKVVVAGYYTDEALTNYFDLSVAKIGETIYTSLQAAIDAVKADETITLLKACDEDVNIEQEDGKGFTIDGNDNDFTGTISIDGTSIGEAEMADEYLVIQNINFVTTEEEHDFITGTITNHYPHNITIQNCDFTGNGDDKDVAIRLKSAYDVTIQNCTGKGLHSFLQNTSGHRMTVKNVTITESKSGLSFGTVQGMTVENVNVTATGDDGYGIRLDVKYKSIAKISNCTLNAYIPVSVRNAEVDGYEIVFAGENTFNQTNNDGYWCVISAGEYSDDGLSKVPGVKVYVKGISHSGVYGAYAEAQINEVYYPTLAEAIADADGKTVTILKDVNINDTLTIAKDQTVTIDLNGKTISQEKACTASYEMINNKGTLTIVDNTTDKAGKISFTDTGAGDSAATWGSYTIYNTGTLVVENGTIENLSAQNKKGEAFAHTALAIFQYSGSTTINDGNISTPNYRSVRLWKGDMTINGGTFEGQVWVHCVDDTSKLVINGGTFAPVWNDGSSVFVNNSGYKTELSVTGGTFTTKIGANDADAIAGAITGGTFTASAKDNTNEKLIAEGYLFEKIDDNNYGVKADPTYGKVAQVEDSYYATLQEAVAAAEAGATITLIADVTTDKVVKITKNLTIDGAGFTMTYTGQDRAIDVPNDSDSENDINVAINDLTVDCTASYCQRGINYNENGTLELDNVKVKGTNVTYALNLPGKATNATVVITKSELTGCIALNVWGANSTITANRTVFTSVDKTEVENYSAICLNNDSNTAAEGATVTITGGEIVALDQNGNESTAVNNQTATGEVNISFTTKWNGNYRKPVAIITYEGSENYYSCYSLQSAIDKAIETNAAEIKLINDIDLDSSVSVKGKVVIDLNGKTITGTDNSTGSFGLINIQPGADLTIKDSTEKAKGKITLSATNDRDWNAYSSVISNQRGTLTVESGTIEHLGGTDMAYGIDNLTNGKDTTATTTINGGTVKSTYRAIRQFLNGDGNAKNNLIVNAGTIEGANKSIWMQDANAKANGGMLKVTENAELNGDVYLYVTEGSTELPVSVSIAAASLKNSDVVTANIPKGYDLAETNGVYGIVEVPKLNGKGTEENPYMINNVEDLILFRDYVNEGNTEVNAPGVYVALGADVDMAGVDWSVNIGDDCSATFDGIFDGKGHTIKNLTSTETAQKGDGYICTGLFGAIYGSAVVKNLTIENVTINTGEYTGNNVGAVVGFAYACTGSVENVKVTGKIDINASGATGVGAIVGYDYYGKLTVKDCSVVGDEGSSITGAVYAGGVVGYASSNSTIEGCMVDNLDITAKCGVSGVAGIMLGSGKAINNTVKNVDLTANHENWKNSAAIVVGTTTGIITVEGTEYDAVTANGETTNVLVGSAYAEHPTEPVPAVQAKIGNKYYTTFAAAYAAAGKYDAIELLTDIEASEVILIGKSVTINGNGHKVTSSATRVFRVNASNVEVTLNDVNMVSTAVRVGTNDVRGISIDSQLSNVKLTLNNCSVDFTDASANDWAYAVNVSGSGTGHAVTVSGGTYEGANVINANGAKNTIVVKDATLNCTYPDNDMYAGSCIWVLQEQGSAVEATGNTFNGTNATAFNLGTGTELTESNNTDNTEYVVVKIGEAYYTSLADAFAAAQDGDTVKLLYNVAIDESVAVKADITLDLNGKTIAGTDNATGSFGLINVNPGKELTVTGNGTITLTATNDRDWNAYSAVISNQRGKLTIESGTIEHLGGTDMAYGIDNLTNGKGTYAETIIDGGTIKSTYRAIRQFLNGVEAQNILTINGGTIEGANKSVWMQDPSVNANTGTLTVGENATLKGDVYLFVTEGSTEWPVAVSIASGALDGESTVVTGNVPNGYEVTEKNGAWTVGKIVAKINGTGFATLEAAFAAAQDGDEVEIVVAGTYALSTSGKDITITGTVDGVVFDNIGARNLGGADVTFNNVTFKYAENSTYKGLQHSGNLTYNDCTFEGQVFLYGESETFNNCAFNTTDKENYNVWTYGAKEVAFNECTFNSAGKSVLIYKEGNDTRFVANVNVNDCEFNASEPVEGKAAIEMDSSLIAGINLTIDNTTVAGFGTGNVSGNSLWNNKKWDETDANNDIIVIVNGETVLAPLDHVAQIGETKYFTLAKAIAAATAGQTIMLLDDVKENITINKNLTIDGADYEYTGTMTVANGKTVTVQNVNFVKGCIDKDKGTSGTLTVKDCDFNGVDGSINYAVTMRGGNKVTIEGCTATGYGYGFLYVPSAVTDVNVKDATVTNVNYGVHVAYGKNVNLENVNLIKVKYGIMTQNYGAKTITVKDSDISSISVWERNTTVVDTFKFVGENKVGTLTDSAQAKLELADADATLTAPEGMNVTSGVADYEVVYEEGIYELAAIEYAAQIGDKSFRTLADANTAATAGDTITLLTNVTEDVTITKAVTIDGAGKTYTGMMTVKADATIKNVNFDGKGYNGYAVETRGANYLTVEDCTAKNYGYGFIQLASGTALTTVKNVTVSDMAYGVKVDYSNTVVLENVDITASVAGLLNSNYGEKTITIKNSDINILGTWDREKGYKTTYVFEGENSVDTFVINAAIDNFKLADATSTLTAPEDVTVTTDVADSEAAYVDGKYTVVDAVRVAAIGETQYKTLATAITAAQAGDTITLLANVTENVTIDKNLTIDGADFNYTGTMTVSNGKTVTVQNVNFVKGCIDKAKGTSGTLTVKNCNFDGVDGSINYAITMRGGSAVTVEGGTVENYGYGFMYVPSATSNVNVTGTEITGVNYGVHIVYGTSASLENVTMTDVAYGIMTQNYGAKTVTIKNCNIAGTKPIYVWERNTTVVDTFNFEGANTLSALPTSAQAKLVLTDAAATLTAPEGANVTTNVDNYEVVYEAGIYKLVAIEPVAQIGDKTYLTLQEAIKDAENGDTIVVTNNIDITELTPDKLDGSYDTYFKVEGKTVTVDLNGKTISGTYVGDMLVGVFSTDNEGHLTLTGNGTVDVTATGKVYSLIANYEPKCSITIENGTYKLDEAIDSLLYTGGNEGIIVNGGNFELGNVGTGENGKPWIFNVLGANEAHAVVNGGTFNADVNHQFWAHEVSVPETKALKNNGDGTWTVVDAVAYAVEKDHGANRNAGYATVAEALDNAEKYNTTTVKLLKDCLETKETAVVAAGVTLDLNGFAYEPKYIASFGDVVDNSEANTGLLVAAKENIMLQTDNSQLPVNTSEGYKFFEVSGIDEKVSEDKTSYIFLPYVEPVAHELLLKGTSTSGVSICVNVQWNDGDTTRSQDFVYTDERVNTIINSYANGRYGRAYSLSISNASAYDNLTYTAIVKSDLGVEIVK